MNIKYLTLFLILCLFMPLSSNSFEDYPQYGQASWYGGKFHGRETASGERFNKYEFTAAHRKLPFGTIVRVTNLRNGKEVYVRINDRGPFVKGRILDLSLASAEALHFNRIEIISLPNGYTKR